MQELIERLKDFAVQIANAKQIEVGFIHSNKLDEIKLPMQVRKNIYLICKEAINNAVKYSACDSISVEVYVKHKVLAVKIKDNGVGFSSEDELKGNGLLNMKNRAKEIGAQLVIKSELKQGTIICFTYRFNKGK